MNQSIIYYRFIALPEEVKKAHNIRSKMRLDCIEYTGDYSGLNALLNHKKQMFVYKTPARDFVNADSQRITEWSLTKSSLNITSLYNEDLDYPELFYGYPNGRRKLSNGSENPFYSFRHDAYLFMSDKDLNDLEMLIIPEQINLIRSWYQMLIDGELDQEIKQLRQDSKPFFDYGYSKL